MFADKQPVRDLLELISSLFPEEPHGTYAGEAIVLQPENEGALGGKLKEACICLTS